MLHADVVDSLRWKEANGTQVGILRYLFVRAGAQYYLIDARRRCLH